MNNKNIKKSIAFLIIVGIAILTVGSYALWQMTKKQSDKNIIGTGCLDISLVNEQDDITLSSVWPTTDADGKNLTPYTFTVQNNCDESVSYSVSLEKIKDAAVPDDSDYLNSKYLKVMLDNSEPAIYGTLNSIPNDDEANYEIIETREILSRTLGPNKSNTHKLRIWLDDDTPLYDGQQNSNFNKHFYGKIRVTAGQDISSECYAINSQGLITNYNAKDCGPFATVPRTVNGINVTGIGSNAFYAEDGPYFHDGDFTTYNSTSYFDNSKLAYTVNLSENMLHYLRGDIPRPEVSCDDIWFELFNGATTSDINWIPGQYQMPGNSNNWKQELDNAGINIADCYPPYETDHEEPALTYYYGINMAQYFRLGNSVRADLNSYTEHYDSGNHMSLVNLLFEAAYYPGPTLKTIGSKAFYDYVGSNNVYYDYGSGNLNLPSSVERIGYQAFYNFSGDGTLTLPTNLSSLGEEAFYSYIGKNKALTIPAVTAIEDNTFYNFNGSSLTLTEGTKVVGDNAFYNFGKLTVPTLTLPNSITSIGNNAFYYYTGGSVLTLPNKLQHIGNNAFYSFGGGTLTLPGSLKTIGNNAFYSFGYDDSNLEIPDNVTYIGSSAFQYYQGQSLILGSRVEQIGDRAFQYFGNQSMGGQNQIDSLIIPNSVKYIGEEAFQYYEGDTLTLGSGLEVIGDRAFQSFANYDPNGACFTLGSNLTTIGEEAFATYWCDTSDEDRLDIPASVTSIGHHAFAAMNYVTVHSQALYDSASDWCSSCDVELVN